MVNVAFLLCQPPFAMLRQPWSLLSSRNVTQRQFSPSFPALPPLTLHPAFIDEFPLPRIDDTLDRLEGACYLLDLASSYWQVEMDSSSKEKTAFTTYSGLYQFRKMPFGLVNAPATFQRLMEVVLSGLARTVCVVYLDDILVFGRSLSEHNANLTQFWSGES